MAMRTLLAAAAIVLCLALVPSAPVPVFAQAGWQGEWEKVLQAARREGKVVAAVPSSAELRKELEKSFTERFKGIQIEAATGSGAAMARKIVEEHKAGVRNFDLFVSGANSPLSLVRAGGAEPVEPYLILPEVKEPKHWWGGYIWGDNASTKRFIFPFAAYMPQLIWYNAGEVKAEEISSYDHLLDAKWKGKIGFLDPRMPGGGQAVWTYIRMVKGDSYLTRLAQQELLITQNHRQAGEMLAKGRLALTLGLSYYTMLPFIQAKLPVKPLPTPKEGVNTTSGSGALTIVKDPPHPNATKVFVNWLLSKDGQEIFGKAMGTPSRRLDVDTKWMEEGFGVQAVKDHLTLEEYYRRQIDLEDHYTLLRVPAAEMAEKLLK